MAKTTTKIHHLARIPEVMMTTMMTMAMKATTIQLIRMHSMTTLPMINGISTFFPDMVRFTVCSSAWMAKALTATQLATMFPWDPTSPTH